MGSALVLPLTDAPPLAQLVAGCLQRGSPGAPAQGGGGRCRSNSVRRGPVVSWSSSRPNSNLRYKVKSGQ